MFPCKLFEIQLSPFIRMGSNNNCFVEDLSLEAIQESREMSSNPLGDLLQQHFQPDSVPLLFQRSLVEQYLRVEQPPLELTERQIQLPLDDQTLLKLVSFVYGRKIIINLGDEMHHQIINYGFKEKLYLTKRGDRYQIVKKKKTPELPKFASEIWSSSKKSTTMSTKYEDDDSDTIIRDCNLFVSEGSNSFSQAKRSDEELFTPPKAMKTSSLSANQDEVKHKNDLLASLNISPTQRHTGKLKFYDEAKSYGFIVMDVDGSDIFVHSDDLLKAGVPKELLKLSKQGVIIRFSFTCLTYIGKYKKSRKAVDLTLLQPSMFLYNPYEDQKSFPPFINYNYTS